MSTIPKKAIVRKIADRMNKHPKEIQPVVQCLLDTLKDELAEGNRIELRNFGVFEIVHRKAKIGRNPKNARIAIAIPAKMAVRFRPGKQMEVPQQKDI